MRRHWLRVGVAGDYRHEPTEAEAAAWALLRNRRCLGLKFRRQHVIRGFIVDFYCPELRLGVEVDGAVHRDRSQAEYDEARSRALATAGIGVVLISNEQVSEARLVAVLERYASPSPRSGEGGRGGGPRTWGGG